MRELSDESNPLPSNGRRCFRLVKAYKPDKRTLKTWGQVEKKKINVWSDGMH